MNSPLFGSSYSLRPGLLLMEWRNIFPLRSRSTHTKEVPDGDAIGMSQPDAPNERAPLPSVSILQTSLTPFSDRTKRIVVGPAKEGEETSAPAEERRRVPPASTGIRTSCGEPESGRVSATIHRPSGENFPGKPSPSRVASPPSTGRTQTPDVFSVGPPSKKSAILPSGEMSLTRVHPSHEKSCGSSRARRTVRSTRSFLDVRRK